MRLIILQLESNRDLNDEEREVGNLSIDLELWHTVYSKVIYYQLIDVGRETYYAKRISFYLIILTCTGNEKKYKYDNGVKLASRFSYQADHIQ